MIFNEILEKIGLKSIDELKPAERETWQAWSKILAKQDVTIDDLKQLLPQEIERAKAELLKYENSKEKDLYYKAYTGVLTIITKLIIAPEQERESLRVMLKQRYGIE